MITSLCLRQPTKIPKTTSNLSSLLLIFLHLQPTPFLQSAIHLFNPVVSDWSLLFSSTLFRHPYTMWIVNWCKSFPWYTLLAPGHTYGNSFLMDWNLALLSCSRLYPSGSLIYLPLYHRLPIIRICLHMCLLHLTDEALYSLRRPCLARPFDKKC